MNGIVQAKLIGGFGNQIHQYAAVRKYASLIDAQLEVPDWVGKRIFGLTEPGWSCNLPEVNDGGNGLQPSAKPVDSMGPTNIRIGGYFQMQRWVGALSRAELRQWLQVRPELIAQCRSVLPVGPYTAAHVRQGDYIGHPLYANIPERAYVRACAEHGLSIDEWVRQNSPRCVAGLHGDFSFLPDFLVLLRSSILLRANSTFSWWAAALADPSQVVYAPVVTDHVGEFDADFVKGNWPRIADARRVGPCTEDLHLPA
jgi:hypothetical protein